MQRTLAIDPSLAGTGWAVFKGLKLTRVGWIPTHKVSKIDGKKITVGESDFARCAQIYSQLLSVVIVESIDFLVVEAPVGSQSANAAKASGMIKGVVASIRCWKSINNMVLLTPFEVKKRICGDSHAEKESIVAKVEKQYPIVRKIKQRTNRNGGFTPAHFAACDAIAIGMAHLLKGQ